MIDYRKKALACISRWERRGYKEQVETFKAIMAENALLRDRINGEVSEAARSWGTLGGHLTMSENNLPITEN